MILFRLDIFRASEWDIDWLSSLFEKKFFVSCSNDYFLLHTCNCYKIPVKHSVQLPHFIYIIFPCDAKHLNVVSLMAMNVNVPYTGWASPPIGP